MADVIFPEIDISLFKGVMVDLDDTLYSYQELHPQALRDVFNRFSLGLTFEKFDEFYRRHRDEVTQRLFPQGCCRSRLLAFQGMVEELGPQFRYQDALAMEELYWNGFYHRMTLFRSAERFLDSCFSSRVPVAVVTDMTTEVQIKKLKALGILDKIFCLVTSEEVGVEKPDPLVFERALRKLGVQPHEAVFLGDSKEKDINGATQVGIQAYLVSHSQE